MCVALLRAIDGASTSIDFAIYGLRGQDEVLAALVRAQARGVMVRELSMPTSRAAITTPTRPGS